MLDLILAQIFAGAFHVHYDPPGALYLEDNDVNPVVQLI